MAHKETIVRSRGRWIGRVLNRYDPDKRPRLTALILAAIGVLIVLFGVLGYAIPALISHFV